VSSSRIDLTWTDNSGDETGFRIERKTGAAGAWAQIAAAGANAAAYASTGLAAGTAYCYRVRAYNAVGNSPYSNEACATTSRSTACQSTIAVPSTTNGALTTSCSSYYYAGYYAKFYTFTLTSARTVTIDMTTSMFAPWLGLRNGTAMSGSPFASAYAWGSGVLTASMTRSLAAGTYTIEASTYYSGQTGSFTLSLR
jgi:hypothetical protein